MAVYLYAVCAGAASLPRDALHGPPLRAIREGGLSAVVADRAPIVEAGEDELWRHENAIELLMDEHDLLPARFGTVLAGDGEVRRLLAQRREQLSAALRRVAGAVELSVRAFWRELAPMRAEDGTAYLEARAERERRARALADTLEGRLAPLARAGRLRSSPAAKMPAVGSYLVARPMVPAFAAEFDRLEGELLDAMLVCTGPWPPYSFVEAEESDT